MGRGRLLVLRALGLGDLLTAVPALRALATEVGDRVGVTMLIPGGMKTHFFDGRPENFKPAPDQNLNSPDVVAASVLLALTRPKGVELRELLVTPSSEPSWP